MRRFQERAARWNEATFGSSRARRDLTPEVCAFLEEALELAQSTMLPRSRVEEVLDRVYGRPLGCVEAEVGDVMTTLAVLCEQAGADLQGCAEERMAYCEAHSRQIREKSRKKPHQRGKEPPQR